MDPKKILVIDDDIDLVEIIRINLENAGYEVIDAQSGTIGIKKAINQQPDIILLDVMMDTIDEGFHTAYKLRQNEETKNIPIIMLTAVSSQTGFHFDKKEDEDFLPVDEFIEKPINPKKLLDVVRSNLSATA